MMKRKDVIQAINLVAKVNIEAAQVILDECNEHWGTAYGWLNRRVVFFDDPDASVSEKYSHCHDAECHIDD